MEALKMSPRRKTVPSTRKHSPSSPSGRGKLIAKVKTKKRSAKKRTALDNHFYRTFEAHRREPAARKSIALGVQQRAGSRPVQRRVSMGAPFWLLRVTSDRICERCGETFSAAFLVR